MLHLYLWWGRRATTFFSCSTQLYKDSCLSVCPSHFLGQYLSFHSTSMKFTENIYLVGGYDVTFSNHEEMKSGPISLKKSSNLVKIYRKHLLGGNDITFSRSSVKFQGHTGPPKLLKQTKFAVSGHSEENAWRKWPVYWPPSQLIRFLP